MVPVRAESHYGLRPLRRLLYLRLPIPPRTYRRDQYLEYWDGEGVWCLASGGEVRDQVYDCAAVYVSLV